ncbi:hypothetical protein DPMN_094944 [Dreissena polymorpha]|uniref:Uncharacterized protein n=1 Tax=Dreissena polymorpha TaxID=45954 RepID=A0A9D4R3Z9_DREPO|nr:hypothetical protein DPMN_094944 [Dreissena polymorpha]
MATATIDNCSDWYTEKIMDKQFHQLSIQVQALQVPRSLYPTVRLRYPDASRGHGTHDTGL